MEAKFKSHTEKSANNKLALAFQKLKGGVTQDITKTIEMKISQVFAQITKDFTSELQVGFDPENKNFKSLLTKLNIEFKDCKMNNEIIVFTQTHKINKKDCLGRYYLILNKEFSPIDCFVRILCLIDFLNFNLNTHFVIDIDQFAYNFENFLNKTNTRIVTRIFLKKYCIEMSPNKISK